MDGQEPVIDGSEATSEFLKEKYSDTKEDETTLPASFDDLIDQKRELKKAKKEIENGLCPVRVDNEIINELGKRKACIGIAPRNIISWKLVSTKRMNSKKSLLKNIQKVAKDEEIYNVTESRRLTEKEINKMATNDALKKSIS